MQDNNKRLAKNTLLLYVRMFVFMAISLYTSRVVLEALGVVDYGIYNVIGGMVAMFGVLNNSMATSTQRFLTYELGKGDTTQLNKVFNTSLIIHLFIAVAIIIVAESIGLWFLYNKMVIPPARFYSALWVYQFSILILVIMVINVPYSALIIAYEKMGAFAYISILDGILKLSIAILLVNVFVDRLILYSAMMFSGQLLIRLIYGVYCKRQFNSIKLTFDFDKPIFKEMFGFVSWNMLGSCASMLQTQGVSILLNLFFGPIINASRGIASQVQNAVGQFANSFQTAIKPQIIKTYASEDYGAMHSLIFRSSRFSFILLFIISLPILLETQTILSLWLTTVPEDTVTFIRIILWIVIVESSVNSLQVAAVSTGNIKRYNIMTGCVSLLVLPISYVVLELGATPYSVFVVYLCVALLTAVVKLRLVSKLVRMSIALFFKNVVLRCVIVTIFCGAFVFAMEQIIVRETFLALIGKCVLYEIVLLFIAYFIGVTKKERVFINSYVRGLIGAIFKNKKQNR